MHIRRPERDPPSRRGHTSRLQRRLTLSQQLGTIRAVNIDHAWTQAARIAGQVLQRTELR